MIKLKLVIAKINALIVIKEFYGISAT